MSKALMRSIIGLLLLPVFSLAAEIQVGMSSALSGASQAQGREMKLGIDTYFHKINKEGGVNGNTLRLIAYDDGNGPDKTASNMRKLIHEDKVLAVLGNVGSPTSEVAAHIANEEKILLFGARTGADALRKTPPDRYVINYRTSIAEETAYMIAGFMDINIKPEEIAFFTQNDSYGDAGYNGAIKALQRIGYKDTARLTHVRYKPNTTDVEKAIDTIVRARVRPKAIIMVGSYEPCAKFIILAKKTLPDTYYVNVSSVGSVALKKALGDHTDNVIVTQVVPHYQSSLSGIKKYRRDLKAFDNNAEPSFVSLEGYIVAKIFVEALSHSGDIDYRKKLIDALSRNDGINDREKLLDALSRTEGNTDQEKLIDGFESIKDFNIGIGKLISFSAQEHQGTHKVWITVIKGNKYVSVKLWKRLLKDPRFKFE